MKFIRALPVLPVVALLVTVLASSASAGELPAPTTPGRVEAGSADVVNTFRNLATGGCLDDSAKSGLRTFGCNKYDYQRWNAHPRNGYVQLRNLATGRCLDDSKKFGIRAVKPCWPDGNANAVFQNWKVLRTGKLIQFRNQSTGLCLADIGGGKLRTEPCSAATNQKWS
ncbi:RICIN domain-containing protein [Amycolatopsis samaneae]|uniref:RICIN domain-containing protein n=1 Tax=Amycolatopsis samaneae TaxID=664691 RepID=A0ABW5GUS7_9PSEU